MSANPAALPAGRPDAEPGLDLQTRILRAEQGLILREQRMQIRLRGLTQRAQTALEPQRLAKPLLAGVLAVGGLWWVLRGRGRPSARRAAHTDHGQEQAPGIGPDLPWTSLLGLAWPMLPDRWRQRVSPTTVSSLLSFGLPLVQQLLARRTTRSSSTAAPPGPELATVAALDLQRFAGTWFEVASLSPPSTESGNVQTKSRYLMQPDGSIALTRRQAAFNGRLQDTQGTAHPLPGSGGAKWRLSFWPQALRWLPLAWTEQWVLQIDEDYTEALVGSPDRSALCLLSRSPTLEPERLQALVQIAHDRGYAVDRLHFRAG